MRKTCRISTNQLKIDLIFQSVDMAKNTQQ